MAQEKDLVVVVWPTIVGRWISGFQYLRNGPEIILKSYKNGMAFAVPTPETYYIHVSSEMLQPKHTMNGLDVKDITTANGSVHSRVLRVSLTSHLTELQLPMLEKVRAIMAQEVGGGKTAPDSWTKILCFQMAKNVIRTANSRVFFGETLSKEERFLTASLQYPDDLLKASEILRVLPAIVARTAAPLLMRKHRGSNVMVEYLIPMIKDRLAKPQSLDKKPLDCVKWMIESNPRKEPWSPEKIVQAVLGLWFASVHQPAIMLIYAMEALCQHAEYVEPLREEIQQHLGKGESALNFDEMPLLDSFLKEAARLYPSDSISVQRKALTPFTFSGGVEVKDEVACVPLRAMMRDPQNYAGGAAFDCYRFVEGDGSKSKSKFVDGDAKFPIWGLGRRIWYDSRDPSPAKTNEHLTERYSPGRYYSVHVMKVAVAHVLLHDDIKLGQEHVSTFHWRSVTIPASTKTQLIRKR
ncbi:MAG: hypothetical protein Q9193_001245 [Seirophora villosa]